MITPDKKRISIFLTKEDSRQLEELKKMLGENTSKVIQRSIIALHNAVSKRNKEYEYTP